MSNKKPSPMSPGKQRTFNINNLYNSKTTNKTKKKLEKKCDKEMFSNLFWMFNFYTVH